MSYNKKTTKKGLINLCIFGSNRVTNMFLSGTRSKPSVRYQTGGDEFGLFYRLCGNHLKRSLLLGQPPRHYGIEWQTCNSVLDQTDCCNIWLGSYRFWSIYFLLWMSNEHVFGSIHSFVLNGNRTRLLFFTFSISQGICVLVGHKTSTSVRRGLTTFLTDTHMKRRVTTRVCARRSW